MKWFLVRDPTDLEEQERDHLSGSARRMPRSPRSTASCSGFGACSTNGKDRPSMTGSPTARRVAFRNSPSLPPGCCASASGWWQVSRTPPATGSPKARQQAQSHQAYHVRAGGVSPAPPACAPCPLADAPLRERSLIPGASAFPAHSRCLVNAQPASPKKCKTQNVWQITTSFSLVSSLGDSLKETKRSSPLKRTRSASRKCYDHRYEPGKGLSRWRESGPICLAQRSRFPHGCQIQGRFSSGAARDAPAGAARARHVQVASSPAPPRATAAAPAPDQLRCAAWR